MSRDGWGLVLVVGLLGGGGSGCDTTFDPFEALDDAHFTIYGYLDAAADTQYVFVTPLRRQAGPAEAPLAAVVTLEHLRTGIATVWRDTLVAGPDGQRQHLFWSDAPLQPGETYRFVVAGAGGAASQATVTLPPDFPLPAFDDGASLGNPAPRAQSLTFSPVVAELAYLEITYYLRFAATPFEPQQPINTSYGDRVRRFGDHLGLGFDAYGDVLRVVPPRSCPTADSATAVIVVTLPGWPRFEGFPLERLALPETVDNIEGGFGFLGGVLSKRMTLPIGSIFDANSRVCQQSF